MGAFFPRAQTSVAEDDDADNDIDNSGGEYAEESPSIDNDTEASIRQARQIIPMAMYVTTGTISPRRTIACSTSRR